jgi:hypothetical protein
MRQFKFLFLLITFIFFSFSFFADCSDDDSKIIVSAHGVWGDREVHIENFEIKPEEALSQLVERLSQEVLKEQSVHSVTSDFSHLHSMLQEVLEQRGVKKLPLVMDQYSLKYENGRPFRKDKPIQNGDVLEFSSRIEFGRVFRGAQFQGMVMKGLNFNGADLLGVSFIGANIKGAKFNGAVLFGAKFSEDFQWAEFQDADLRYASIMRANLRGANFVGARLKGSRFKECDFSGADFSMTNWGEATFENCLERGALWWPNNNVQAKSSSQQTTVQCCNLL